MCVSRFLCLAGALLALPLSADVIVSVAPPDGNTHSTAIISSYQVGAVSWTTTSGYSNVSISFNYQAVMADGQATAYLMRQIGPGTTSADEVATNLFSYAQTGFSFNNYVEVFSGLTLDAGTYYLVIGPGSSSLGWGVKPATRR